MVERSLLSAILIESMRYDQLAQEIFAHLCDGVDDNAPLGPCLIDEVDELRILPCDSRDELRPVILIWLCEECLRAGERFEEPQQQVQQRPFLSQRRPLIQLPPNGFLVLHQYAPHTFYLLAQPVQRLLKASQPLPFPTQTRSEGYELFIIIVDELNELLPQLPEIGSKFSSELFERYVDPGEEECVDIEAFRGQEGMIVCEWLERGEVEGVCRRICSVGIRLFWKWA